MLTKGDIMEKLFSKEELRNVDAAVPMGSIPKGHDFFYVMDYNGESALGKLVNMRTLAFERGILEMPPMFNLNPWVATIHIEFGGDRSVGIQPWSRTMTVHRDCVSDDESRAFVKEQVKKLYAELEDFIPVVFIDDELIFEND